MKGRISATLAVDTPAVAYGTAAGTMAEGCKNTHCEAGSK